VSLSFLRVGTRSRKNEEFMNEIKKDKRKDKRKGGVWWPNHTAKRVRGVKIDVIIPALNEEKSLPLVLDEIPSDWVRRVVVVDNGSTDRTAFLAEEAGAIVIREDERGYGAACLAGLAFIRQDPPDIVVFLDGDHSDYPSELPRVVEPIIEDGVEMVIGSRTIGKRQKGALLPQAIFGNKLACSLVEILYGYQFSDLGPFRAVKWEALEKMAMADRDYGWTVEMQVKAARMGISSTEVPVSYRKRIGRSKITGTLKGTVKAGYKILYTIFAQYGEN